MDELISYIEPKKVFMHELISYIEPLSIARNVIILSFWIYSPEVPPPGTGVGFLFFIVSIEKHPNEHI